MLFEPLQELQHLYSIALKFKDLRVLLMYLRLTYGSNKGKVLLNPFKMILWG